MYDRFAEWLDVSLNTELSENLAAFCFNLYEEENKNWSVELIGASTFDEETSDWACEECFSKREFPFRWQEDVEWEDIHSKIETYIRQYLVIGRYAEVLKEYQAVAMGFVDGDLTIIYKSETNKVSIKCPICGKETRSGVVKTQAIGNLLNNTMISWYPEEDKDKWIQRNAVELRLKAKGYYCFECMKVFAVFEEK